MTKVSKVSSEILALSNEGRLLELSVLLDSLSPSRILPLFSLSTLINSSQPPMHVNCQTIGESIIKYQQMANPYSALLKFTFIFAVIASGITGSENFSGDALNPGQSTVHTAPVGWSGRIWARTGCNFDKNGNGNCQTGGCGTNINCMVPGSPPATIAEFTLGEPDFYDVSLVDGFNLPVTVKDVNGTGNCSTAGCDRDLRKNCPSQLASKNGDKVTACRSACDVFNTDEYCCRGAYGNPATCLSSNYSTIFKQVCPAAYSFAHDDPSIITCSGADFIIIFCGLRNQTVCSYHGRTVACNESKTYKAIPQRWLTLMLPLVSMFTSWITW
ncbi:Pathogenesis-related protein 5 [Spatholobus suberectus]|nr:Pathogenesis-related protein 5 [Spatholobus suberectus]